MVPHQKKRDKPLKTQLSSLCDAISDFIHCLSTENNGDFKLQDWTPCARNKNILDSCFGNHLAYGEQFSFLFPMNRFVSLGNLELFF